MLAVWNNEFNPYFMNTLYIVLSLSYNVLGDTDINLCVYTVVNDWGNAVILPSVYIMSATSWKFLHRTKLYAYVP